MSAQIVIGPSVVEWVASRTNEYGNFGCAVGIGLERDGALIAGVAYAEFNGVNMVAHIASDGSRQWMTRQYLWTIFDYPFRQAKVRRLTVAVGEGNLDSRRLVEHMGFSEECRLQGAHPTGDLILYRMWQDECRFLEMRGNHAKQAA